MKNLDTVVDTVSDFAHETVDKATKGTQHAVDKIDKEGVQLKHAEQRLTEECSIYIRDNPLTSVGIAMGVGFILSKLLSSR